MLVTESIPGTPAKLSLNLDLDKKLYVVNASFNNFDVLISPLQIYTLTHFIDYASFIFDTYQKRKSCSEPVQVDEVKEPVEVVKPIKKSHMKSKTPETTIKLNIQILRTTIRIQFEDFMQSKRYFEIYKHNDLLIEGNIPSPQLKFSYSYCELLLVNTRADVILDSRVIECKGSIHYAGVTMNLLQDFALRKGDQSLEDSSDTIYESTHRIFSITSESINFLTEENFLKLTQCHFCVQPILEFRSKKSLRGEPTSSEEWEHIINNTIGKDKDTYDNSQNGISFALKLEKRKGEITCDHMMSIFEDPNLAEARSLLNIVTVELSTSGLLLDLSPDALIRLLQIFIPTENMILQNQKDYKEILELYNTDIMNIKMKGMGRMINEVKELLPITENIRENVAAAPDRSKDWILESFNIKIPFIRAKIWIIDKNKSPFYDYYEERYIGVCRDVLETMKNPSAYKCKIYLKENPYTTLQACRCMDMYRMSNLVLKKTETTQCVFYRDELVIIDIMGIKAVMREKHEKSIIRSRFVIQALLTDFSIDKINAYTNLGEEMKQILRITFAKSPYSVRVIRRDRITNENKMLEEAEINSKKKEEFHEEDKETKIGVIETLQVEGVKVSFQNTSDKATHNLFAAETCDFSEREAHLKQFSKVLILTRIEESTVITNIKEIMKFLDYIESFNDTLYKVTSMMERMSNVMKNAESYLNDIIKKEIQKALISPISSPQAIQEKLSGLDDAGLDIVLGLQREESRITFEAQSESSDSAESKGKFSLRI